MFDEHDCGPASDCRDSNHGRRDSNICGLSTSTLVEPTLLTLYAKYMHISS